MNACSSSSSHDPSALVGRRRLKAAQRLAAGEPVVLAAARVGVPTKVVREALEGDEDFFELIEACREIHHLPREAWFKHLEEQLRDAVDEALAAGRVSVVNHLLKATGALDEVRSAAAARTGGMAGFDGAGGGRAATTCLSEAAGQGEPAANSRDASWGAGGGWPDVRRASADAADGDGAGAVDDDAAGIARSIAKILDPGYVEPDADAAEVGADDATASLVSRNGEDGEATDGGSRSAIAEDAAAPALAEADAPAFEGRWREGGAEMRHDGERRGAAAEARRRAGAGAAAAPSACGGQPGRTCDPNDPAGTATAVSASHGPVDDSVGAARFGLDAGDGAEAVEAAAAASDPVVERAAVLLGMLGRYALPRPIGRVARHLAASLPAPERSFNPRASPH